MGKDLIRILLEKGGKDGNGWEGINFTNAISCSDEKCFTLSGSKRILSYLKEEIGEDASYFIDFSAIPSAFRNDGKMADFITVYDPNNQFVSQDRLEKAFHSIYDPLQKENKGLFYHPYFFDYPEYAKFYFSQFNDIAADNKLDTTLPEKTLEDIQTDTWLDVDKAHPGSVCFINKSFTFSFDKYHSLSEKSDKSIQCKTRNHLLHFCYNQFLLKDGVDRSKTFLLSIPLIGYPSQGKDKNKGTLEGLGALFIYFVKESFDEKTIGRIANDLWFLGLQITYNSLFHIAMDLADTARKEAVKSAKAAIMSRNMSHNLGSHVMAYLKQHLSSVSSVLHDNVLAELFMGILSILDDSYDDNEREEHRKTQLVFSEDSLAGWIANNPRVEDLARDAVTSEKLALPFLIGLGHFISYLQERQDFIATIATDFIPYYASVNFKDFVYDELNPDKRYERHKDRKNLALDNILLGNIARSEGLGRRISPTKEGNQSDIILSFGYFNGDKVESNEGEGIMRRADLERMRKINICLPGGVVGRQAVFSIIENIIRNAAKHGNWRSEGNLNLRIDMFKKSEWEDPQSEIDSLKRLHKDDRLDDNSLSLKEVLDKYYFPAQESQDDDLYYMIITDNLNYDKHVIGDLRRGIVDEYIDKDSGIMRETNKGIKEIRISAAWIRSLSDDLAYAPKPKDPEDPNWDWENDKNWDFQVNKDDTPPVVYARLSKEIDVYNDIVGYHLQYIFCIPKPRKVALLSKSLSGDRVRLLKESDWDVITTPEEFLNKKNKSYEFILLDDSPGSRFDFSRSHIPPFTYKSTKDELRIVSSSRFFSLSDVGMKSTDDLFTIQSGKTSFDADNQLKRLYEFLSQPKPEDAIAIQDGKASIVQIGKDIVADAIVSGHQKVEFSEGRIVRSYLYRTHHEDLAEFKEFRENPEAFDCCQYVESITGNNSTDRLVRTEIWDLPWFYRHLHAMKEQIAIFDERLFSKTHSIEEADFTLGKEPEYMRMATNDLKTIIKKKYANEDRTWNLLDNNRSIINTLRKLHPEFLEKDTVETYSNGGIVARHKGIHVFTMIRDVIDPKKFNIYGLYHEIPGTQFRVSENYFKNESHSERAFAECIKLASVYWIDNPELNEPHLKIQLHDSLEDNYFGEFDRISIHQGLLDKLYSSFGIKKQDFQKKEWLTKDFFSYFSKKKDCFSYMGADEVEKYFLPGLSIHSGRSKPGEEDMPQRLPFIQFSAIEHDLSDSKYSLVNLLDFARYEPRES